MFANLNFDPKKEIGEIAILVITILIAVFAKTGFWIALLIFFVLEILYLLVYSAIERKIEAGKPEPDKPVKEEINFHEYDDEDQ